MHRMSRYLVASPPKSAPLGAWASQNFTSKSRASIYNYTYALHPTHISIAQNEYSSLAPRERRPPQLPLFARSSRVLAPPPSCTAPTRPIYQLYPFANTTTYGFLGRSTQTAKYHSRRASKPPNRHPARRRPSPYPPLPNRRPDRPASDPLGRREASRLDALLPRLVQHALHPRARRNPHARAVPRRH